MRRPAKKAPPGRYIRARTLAKTYKAVLLQIGNREEWFPRRFVLDEAPKLEWGRPWIADWILLRKGITTKSDGRVHHVKPVRTQMQLRHDRAHLARRAADPNHEPARHLTPEEIAKLDLSDG
jgi:hypothetical protein